MASTFSAAEMDLKYELVLKRFEDENLLVDYVDDDHVNRLELTREQRVDFMVAFNVVAGDGVQSVPVDKVEDVLMAAGYIFQKSHIDE